MASKEYQFYTARDFALDEDFQNWVLHPDVRSKYFWEMWQREHPEKSATVNEAIVLVRSVQFRPYELSNDEKEKLWESVWDEMDEVETEVVQESISSRTINTWRKKWKYAAAAIFLGLIVMSALWLQKDHSSTKAISVSSHAGFGEVKKLILPDSSEVTLNANSEVVYAENDNVRQVWLKGEAYFHVKHTNDTKEFIVHTYDDLSVKVLGTRFNVNTVGKQISVVLQQGSIQMGITASGTNRETQLYLRPGEIVKYNKLTGDYSKSKVEASRIVSWASGRLVMDNYTLSDVRAFVQNVFDKELIIQDSDLLRNGISGSMPIVYNLDTMLVQFSKAFQIHFYRHRNEIRVKE